MRRPPLDGMAIDIVGNRVIRHQFSFEICMIPPVDPFSFDLGSTAFKSCMHDLQSLDLIRQLICIWNDYVSACSLYAPGLGALVLFPRLNEASLLSREAAR